MGKDLRNKTEQIQIFVIVLLLTLISINCVCYFTITRFLRNTEIGGISCEFLTQEEAIEKINTEIGKEIITFSFSDGKTFDVTFKQLGAQVDETYITQIFDQQHAEPKSSRRYSLNGFILVDVEKLMEIFKQIPELQEENMVSPQDAFITWDETEFSIQKEEMGNVIDLEEAILFSIEKLSNGEKQIDFSPITDVTPEILEADLVQERNNLNSILNSSINFELTDGSTVTFDSNTIKNWVNQEEKGKFTIDVDNAVTTFVEELAIKIDEANSSMKFKPTDFEEFITINVPNAVRAQLDKEKEIIEIKSLLGTHEPINKKPIYDRELISDMLANRVEIDKSRQQVWVYKDGILKVDTPCVTGNERDGHGTPTGLFFLLNKNRDVNLEGLNNVGSKYSSHVEYWMRFYKGVGMHDAPWRSKFGGNIYLTGGSHGCVNLPSKKAEQIYDIIDDTMPIIVYESQPQ